jgi:uncharacterized protein
VRALIAVVVLALAGACGGSAARCEVAAPTARGAPFLWKATRPGAPGVVWLFGTVHHVGEASVPPAAWAALDGAPRFVSELGDVEPDSEALREVTLLPRGPGLDQQLPADDWYDLRDLLRGVVKEADLARVRPWYAMSKLMQKVAPPVRPTIDDALIARAERRDLPIDHLETWEQQLAALGDSVSIADLQQALHARATMRCELATMRTAYEAGDTDALARSLAAPAAATLLHARNRAWLPQLEALAAAGGGFVTVGLGHLLGDEGVPALLAARGFTVERAAP